MDTTLEGDTDEGYFKLASRLYFENHGRRLIGEDFTVFSVGTGDEGGTPGIIEWFPPLLKLIDADVDERSNRLYRVAVLVDGDSAGKKARNALLASNRKLLENRDVFVLNRIMPRKCTEPKIVSKQIEAANNDWRQLD